MLGDPPPYKFALSENFCTGTIKGSNLRGNIFKFGKNSISRVTYGGPPIFISGGAKWRPHHSPCKFLGGVNEWNFEIFGVQKKFFWGALPPNRKWICWKWQGGFVALGEGYQAVKKFSENSQGVPRYLGSKKNFWRHLAAKLELLGWKWKGE